MIDFINMIIDCDDFETLLGDMYQPTIACLVVSWGLLSFGALCEAFIMLVKSIFRGGSGNG